MYPLNPSPLLDKKTPANANKTIKNKKSLLSFYDDKHDTDNNLLNDSNNNYNNNSNNNSNNDYMTKTGDNDLIKKLYTQNNETINNDIKNRTIINQMDNNNNNPMNNPMNNNNHPLKYSYDDNYPQEFPSVNNEKVIDQQYLNDYNNANNANNANTENTVLLNKLDYLINLLEEQKGQKTTYVTEELILYTFLGIFIIFVLDNFTKFATVVAPTKYTR